MRNLSFIFAASSRDISSKVIRSMSSNNNLSNILAESWSTISNDYEKVLVPRFAPWTQDSLTALRCAVNNDMKCSRDAMTSLVLCCGPGHELLPIAKMLGPTAKVLGTDLAPGMIDAAKKRIESECNDDDNRISKGFITAEVGDAMHPPAGPYHVIFSAFGLQQLPRPIQAVQSWINVMEPGGICVFIYWPPNPPKIPGEENGPFEVWGNLVKQKLGKQSKDYPWDENIGAAVEAAGGEVIENRLLIHSIRWKDAEDMFVGMSRAGPWHAMRLRRGDDFVDKLGKEVQALYPPGESLCHQFTARMVVVRRRKDSKM